MLQTEQHNPPVGVALCGHPEPGQTHRVAPTIEGAEQPSMFLPFRFFPAEREVAKKMEELTVSQRAEKYRVVTKSKITGPWRNANNPALVGLMDAYGLAYVRKIVLCKCIQGGGTEFAYNCILTEMM